MKEPKPSLLSLCRDPRHRDLFKAVFETTQHRSDVRARQAERAAQLKTLYERHLGALQGDPE
jgi:hypothetical protein